MKKIMLSTMVAAVGLTLIAPTASEAASKEKLNKKNVLVDKSTGKAVKGFKVYKGKLYKNGKLNKGYAVVGSGASMKLYYNAKLKKGLKTAKHKQYLFENGRLTKKLVEFKSLFYYKGQLANETIDGVTYTYGKNTSGSLAEQFVENVQTALATNGDTAAIIMKYLETNGQDTSASTSLMYVENLNTILPSFLKTGSAEEIVASFNAVVAEAKKAEAEIVKVDKQSKELLAQYQQLQKTWGNDEAGKAQHIAFLKVMQTEMAAVYMEMNNLPDTTKWILTSEEVGLKYDQVLRDTWLQSLIKIADLQGLSEYVGYGKFAKPEQVTVQNKEQAKAFLAVIKSYTGIEKQLLSAGVVERAGVDLDTYVQQFETTIVVLEK